ncbi:Alpha/Beta hydrolase protein [Ephemerocybe angulata]|uniref:Alpha/Beta hydrolase protein n=1 Tax=Ephemerocybe angulata TaxID=980116 RepID=A0A8H6IGN2_9AGAR|nr:Alpha/Beta hydrolase protein [Tulosesus angulatus]
MSKLKQKLALTEEDREMYAAERLDNFRWIAKVLASYSDVHLTEADRVPSQVCEDISEIGQFAEIVYSSMPIDKLLERYTSLSHPGFPLEGYDALFGSKPEASLTGDVAQLPACIFWRQSHPASQALQDVRVLKTKHPSKKGYVHTGFWSLYQGLEARLKSALRQALEFHGGDVDEVVLTGHSMGGAVAYLLGIDLLSDSLTSASSTPTPGANLDPILLMGNEAGQRITLKLVTFGMPRAGDKELVDHFRSLVDQYQEKVGTERFVEYSIRTYNDGVPTLPPTGLGYRHFPKGPIYATGEHLYYIPHFEAESTLFHVDGGVEDEAPSRFPRGGHNYYGGRELERLLRRIDWLVKADMEKDDAQWEERYLSMAQKKT